MRVPARTSSASSASSDRSDRPGGGARRWPTRRISAATGLLATLLWAIPCSAHDGQKQPFLERIEVEVLSLEVVVTDRDGQRIPGLTADDFELLVDGQETRIDYFAEIREGGVHASEASSREEGSLPKARTAYLVFIDEFFSIQRDKDRVLTTLKQQLANLGPNDVMAVVAWKGGVIEILSSWQGSQQALEDVLERAMEREALGLERTLDRQRHGIGPGIPTSSSNRLGTRLETEERAYAHLLATQMQAAVGAASAAMRSLPAFDGRHALVLLAGGWPYDLANHAGRFRTLAIEEPGIPNGTELYSPLMRTANLLGYTIYGVDIPGLQAGSGVNASRGRPTSAMARSIEFEMESDLHASLTMLADETGGLAFLNGERLQALESLGKDLQSYYSIGFTPLLEGDDVRRDLEVRVRDENLRARTRAAYYDLSPEAQMELAVESSLLFGPPQRSPLLDVVVSELEKKRRGRVEAKLTFLIQAEALTRKVTADGWTAEAVLFVGALDEKGGRSEITPIQILLNGKAAPSQGESYSYEKTVKLHWKTKRLSVALYDIGGSRTFVTVLDR